MRKRRIALLTPLALAAVLAVPYPGGAAPAQDGEQGPGFLSGPNEGDPDDIAVDYLRDTREDYGVTSADLSDMAVRTSYVSKHTGVTHVNLYQEHQDLEVFGATATVNVAKDGSVVFVGHTLVAELAEGASGSVESDAAGAVEAAADELGLDDPAGLRTLRSPTGPDQETLLSGGGISDAPIPARLGWQPTDDGLRLAWQLVIDDSSDVHLYNATIDAETGDLLNVDDWTTEHNPAAMASTLARSGVQATTSSVGTHRPANPVEDGSNYRVLEVPTESPNDGPRTLVTNPADGDSSPFGWHDTDGVSGPEFTITRGNNAHAYLDQDNNNQPDFGQDVDGGSGLSFDFDADLTEHAQDYRDAVASNLFYTNNVIHDVMYGYGFDEVAGNFQANKYGATLPNGNPVPGGDYVRAEAADGGGTNNANFSTPANYGGTPRMQMFLWPGNQFGSQNTVTIGETTFGANFARFGPPARNTPVSGEVVYAGTGCDASLYPADPPAGFVAVVDGLTSGTGSCTHPVRTGVAESLGASAVIVANVATTAAPILSGSQAGPPSPIGIPAVSVTQADGNSIKAAAGATANVHKSATHPGIRDGDFENGIIIHEYGHGISNRLTGGPGINCLSGNEQMGEGWSDYYAITMLLDPELDNPEVARGMGPYALFQDSRNGNGIRPRPYTRDMNVQPFTYDRIKTNAWITGQSLAIPHGIGHTWAATLWDMNWNLIERHGFNPNIYDDWSAGGNNLALQLVTDGLKLQGCGPGFVVGRNAIIAADLALAQSSGGPDNNCLLWSTFARRGLGYSAVQGTTNRDDNTEAFDVPPWCRAPGDGFVGPTSGSALNTVDAGSAAPVQFNLGGNLGLDILRSSHSPSSQQISCATQQPIQYAITTPTQKPGKTALTYNSARSRYQYLWETDASWVGTCRQLIVTLNDGTQHRANFQFVVGDDQ